MALVVENILIDCLDLDTMRTFWCEALDLEHTWTGPSGGYLLVARNGSGFRLALMPSREEKTTKNRVHLDVRPDDQLAEVERLERLGAQRIDVGQPGARWIVMADPEGNEFCVLRSKDPEKTAILEFLDYQRNALINKVENLSEAESRATPTTSSLSLLSILRHSTIWEKRWFEVIVAGRASPGDWAEVQPTEPDVTFELDDDDTIASVVDEYRAQVAVSNEILTTFDLDAPCALENMKGHSLRWVALHMIEETARHAGHADIIRETLDNHRPTPNI